MAAGPRGNLLSSLNNDAANEIYKFIKFFDVKKDGILKMIGSEFEEAIDLMDESEYRREEVANHVIAPLKQGVRQTVKDEQNTYVNMMVLLLKQMFESAEQEGCHIVMDMSEIEDVSLLQQVSQLRLDPRNRPEAETKQEPSTKLVSIKDEHIQIMKDKSRLELELSTTASRMREMQAEIHRLQRTNISLSEDMERLKGRPQSERNESSRSEAESKNEAKETGTAETSRVLEENVRLTRLLRDQEDQNKVSSSSQVQQLRRLLQQKNELVASLRSRLEYYEPSTLKNDADDD